MRRKRIVVLYSFFLMMTVHGFSNINQNLDCKKMFGEWAVRFSDDPRVPGKGAALGIIPDTGMNRVIISVRPAGQFDVSYRQSRWFLLTEMTQKGRYRVVERVGSSMKLEVSMTSCKETMISFCGIEMDEVRPVIRMEEIPQTYVLDAELFNKDLYLMAVNSSGYSFYYHLVRFQGLNEPPSQLTMSNLVFSNALTMLLTYGLHMILHLP